MKLLIILALIAVMAVSAVATATPPKFDFAGFTPMSMPKFTSRGWKLLGPSDDGAYVYYYQRAPINYRAGMLERSQRTVFSVKAGTVSPSGRVLAFAVTNYLAICGGLNSTQVIPDRAQVLGETDFVVDPDGFARPVESASPEILMADPVVDVGRGTALAAVLEQVCYGQLADELGHAH